MKNKETQKKKEAYTKPELVTHAPLRDITATGSRDCPTWQACQNANENANFKR